MPAIRRDSFISGAALLIASAALVTAILDKDAADANEVAINSVASREQRPVHHEHPRYVTQEEVASLLNELENRFPAEEKLPTPTQPRSDSASVTETEMTKRLRNRPVDLSGYSTAEAKLGAIMNALEGVNVFSVPHPIIDQLQDLSPEATRLMLARLVAKDLSGAQKGMMVEALRTRLSPEHHEQIVEVFLARGEFADYLASAGVEAIEEPIFQALRTGTMRYNNGTSGFHREFIEAAIKLDPDRAEAALRERVMTGNMDSAIAITTIPDADARGAIELAVAHARSEHSKTRILPHALEYGIEGSLDLAIEALENSTNSHRGERVSRAVREYTGAIGGVEDVAAWLRENKHKLEYEPAAKVYRLREEP